MRSLYTSPPLVIILHIHVIVQSRRVNLSSLASVDDLPMAALSSSHLSSICPAFFPISTFKWAPLKRLGIPRVFFPLGKLSISFIALRLVQDDLLVGPSYMCPVVRFFSILSKKSWNTEIYIAFALKTLSLPFLWEVPNPNNVNGNGSGKLLPTHLS